MLRGYGLAHSPASLDLYGRAPSPGHGTRQRGCHALGGCSLIGTLRWSTLRCSQGYALHGCPRSGPVARLY